MNRAVLQKWLDNLRRAWVDADMASVKNIFQKTECYFETPFSEPVSGEGIWNLWAEVKKGDLDYLEYEIIAIESNTAVVNERFSWKSNRRDGIYLLKFDADDFCIFFKRWKITE